MVLPWVRAHTLLSWLVVAESNIWRREQELGEVSHRSPWILLCLQAGRISFYLVEKTGLMENGAAVCTPAGIKIRTSDSSLVCKGSWSTSGILWMRMIENFTLTVPLHGCSWQVLLQGCRCNTWLCPCLGHLDSAPRMAQRYL